MRLYFQVKSHQSGIQLSDFLRGQEVSVGLMKQVKYTPTGILVDGVRTNTNQLVYEGQNVEFLLPQEDGDVAPQPMLLDVVAETEHFVLLNKPAGMVVHPTFNYATDTLANGWIGTLAARGQTGVFRPVNRIDKDTSGLVLCAKNCYAAPILADRVQKVYLAIAVGEMPLGKGEINLPIARCDGSLIKREISPEGQPSITQYEVLAAAQGYSVLRLHLITGRTHQIRVHLAALGHPLAGDWLYGTEEDSIMNRQALHCFGMKIPAFLQQKETWFFTPPPADMQMLYQKICQKKSGYT